MEHPCITLGVKIVELKPEAQKLLLTLKNAVTAAVAVMVKTHFPADCVQLPAHPLAVASRMRAGFRSRCGVH